MKLNENFLVHTVGEETILVPTGNAAFSGMVRGNKMLGFILDLLKTETTEEAMIATVKARFEAPEGVIEQDVKDVLNRLKGIGAIDG